MTWTIGIFDREQQVLDAVNELQARGNNSRSLLAVVNNEENAPLLSSQDELRLEGIEGLKEASERWDGDDGLLDEGAAMPAAMYLGSVQGAGMNGQAGAFAAYSLADSDGLSTTRCLERLGLDESTARNCAPSVEEGKLLLLAETDSLEETARVMRSCGASDVLQ
ncbi:general stress protein [Cohnella thailandensis]|uniref:General stress protein n=1 Tax=Cohnella thailandensis TaxID=557557 RepID=A0A841T4V2_9BACL|nr:general stress protein [Cohnella thailandensis]MBB6637876.1 general stress protein [Cohnella thailandensis]MBP1977416.1 hypothetical protein [Cohnella thailandensis]